MYEYGHEQLKQGKRDEIIKQIENKFVNRKFEKKGGGKSVPPAPVRMYQCMCYPFSVGNRSTARKIIFNGASQYDPVGNMW